MSEVTNLRPINQTTDEAPIAQATQVIQANAKSKGLDEKFCSDCGEVIKIKAEICPKCGVRQKQSQPNLNKNKTSAAILAFFLGGLGAHKFYLGKIGQGIAYLLFFWTFIPATIAFVEFIIFLTMSDDAFNQKYNNAF